MKYVAIIVAIGFLAACAPISPIPPEITAKIAKTPIEDLPVYASIEHQRCPKPRLHSPQKRTECRQAVRREIAARDMMKTQNQKIYE